MAKNVEDEMWNKVYVSETNGLDYEMLWLENVACRSYHTLAKLLFSVLKVTLESELNSCQLIKAENAVQQDGGEEELMSEVAAWKRV